MRNIYLAKKEFYHIYNRGTDKRKTFLYKSDYQRFADGLFVFNDEQNLNGCRFEVRLNSGEATKKLVNVVAYCLMPNHFHLLLEQCVDDGITKFIQKMVTSYTMYFNKSHERTGVLFQGIFKRSHIKSNSKLLELSRYIHSNPIKIFKGANDANLRKDLLEYRWSSFSDYAGIRKDSKILSNTSVILDQFDSPNDYVRYVLGET
jgi:putative transposase